MPSRILTFFLFLLLSFTASGQCFIQAPIQICQGSCGPVFWLLNDPPGTTYSWTIDCGTITNPNAANPHIVCYNTPGLCRIDVVVNRPGEEPDTCTAYSLIEPTSSESIVEILCEGDSIEINGTYYSPGIYHDTIFGGNVHNCDSFLTIVVGEIIPMKDTISDILCNGESITINGTIYDQTNLSGIDTIIGSMGCIERITTIDLTFFPPTSTSISYVLCNSDSIIVNGTIYNESNPAGTEVLAGQDQHGCDSIVTISLLFNSLSFDTISYSGCSGDGFSVIVNSVLYDESNPEGQDTLISSNGCDSITTIQLVFALPSHDTISYIGCQGDGYSVTVMDSLFDESNPSGTLTFQTTHCDSIIVIDLHYADCPDSLIITGHSICVSGTGSDYTWHSCNDTLTLDTLQCITVGDTGCVCVTFTDGSGYDTLCLQYNVCDLAGEIISPHQACVGDVIRISYATNDTTLESGTWTVRFDSTNTQVYDLTDSLWLTFDAPGCYPINLMLQDSGCTSFTTDTICIFEKPTVFICCDQVRCDSCVPLTIFFSGEPPFSFAITDGINIDTVYEVNTLMYDYMACPPYDTSVIYTLLWMSDHNAACDASILTPSASVYLEPFPEATISIHGDTLCAGPSGQLYRWFDCQNQQVLGFDQCLISPGSGCYCVNVTTLLTDCEDTACINYIVSATHHPNPADELHVYFELSTQTITIDHLNLNSEDLTLQLIDILGREIKFERKNLPDGSITLTMSDLPTSIAFLTIFNEEFRISKAVFISKE